MAVTLPTSFALIRTPNLARPGGPIVESSTDTSAQTWIEQLNRCFAEPTRRSIAQGLDLLGQDESAGGGVYATRYRCAVRLWSSSVRMRLTVYGEDCDVRVTVGTQTITVTCAALGFYQSAVTALAGVVLDANGFADVYVDGRLNGAAPNKHYAWVLEERPMLVGDLPDSTNTATDFQRLDTAAWTADFSYDDWLGQQLVRNAREAARARGRGCAYAWPLNRPSQLCSVFRRAHGPYVLWATPYSDTAELVVTAAATVRDVDIWAGADGESDQDGLARAVTLTAGAGYSHTRFVLPHKHQQTSHRPNKFWIGYQGAVGNTLAVGFPIISQVWGVGGQFLSDNSLSAYVPVLPGTIVQVLEPVWQQDVGAIKPTLSNGLPYQVFDFAAHENGTVGVEDNDYVWLSPPRAAAARNAPAQARNAILFDAGALSLYGVWVGERFDRLADQTKEVPPYEIPSSGVIRRAAEITNQIAGYATTQIAAAIPGQRRQPSGTPGAGNTQLGDWRFVEQCPAFGQYRDVAVWLLPANNDDTAAGIDAASICARAQAVAICSVKSRVERADIIASWRLVIADTPNEDLTDASVLEFGTVVGGALPARYAERNDASETVADISAATRIAAYYGGVTYEHGYLPQSHMWTEALAGGIWADSPIATMAKPDPANLPAFLKLQVTFRPYTSNAWYIVCGAAEAWWSPRS